MTAHPTGGIQGTPDSRGRRPVSADGSTVTSRGSSSSPPSFFLAAVVAFPVLYTAGLSLFRWSGAATTSPAWVGLGNYARCVLRRPRLSERALGHAVLHRGLGPDRGGARRGPGAAPEPGVRRQRGGPHTPHPARRRNPRGAGPRLAPHVQPVQRDLRLVRRDPASPAAALVGGRHHGSSLAHPVRCVAVDAAGHVDHAGRPRLAALGLLRGRADRRRHAPGRSFGASRSP